MPVKEEKALRKQALKLQRKGALKGTVDQYVYGTLRKTGWKPSTQKNKGKK